jgi:hypothetical protein
MSEQPQPRRVTPGDIADLLDQARGLGTPVQASDADRLAYYERKADLLTRLAEDLATIDADDIAADARAYAAALRAGTCPGDLGVAS